MLATVLFTDIVGSTEHAARLGDRRWHALISDHDRIVQSEIADFRGRASASRATACSRRSTAPARAIRCAVAVVEAVRSPELDL